MLFTVRYLIRSVLDGGIPPEPEIDPDNALPHPALLRVRELARAGRWQSARELVDETAPTDWDLRQGLLGEMTSVAVEDGHGFDTWVASHPDDPTVVLMQAEVLDRRAGDARGGAPASETSAQQFADFHALSTSAKLVGKRAMEVALPGDPQPWTLMLSTMFADSSALRTSFGSVYAEGRRRDPHNFALHSTAITLHCQKWFGSHEQMFGMARTAAAEAPPGHKTALLPLYAHFEYAMREYSWNTFTSKSLRDCKRYFRRREVRADIDQWIAKFRAAPPTSVRIHGVRQWMAMYYSLSGQHRQAKVVFAELGTPVAPIMEWAWFWGSRKYGFTWSWWRSLGIH
ncbi:MULTISPECIES: hypothetical protein [Actinoplanes]|uniref:hypothetical protein n=1 Tax=Actinoplanes TaxID=1865 RepID=UPI0005F2EBC8|nr:MULTISPECIES: hypothetical protein [Actinoplanes]GLY02989.1 hypothetical protein Acsp01_33680 [Actinoplanes sp. NBRC 101535]